MLKVEVSYAPEGAHKKRNIVLFCISIGVLIFGAIAFYGGDDSQIMQIVAVILMIFFGGVTKFMTSGDSTDVVCYEDELVCSCGEKEWIIDLEELETVRYSIKKNAEGSTASYFCKLEFRYKDGREDFLTDEVDEQHFIDSKSGEREELPILEIYYWIESLYPEKARGRRKFTLSKKKRYIEPKCEETYDDTYDDENEETTEDTYEDEEGEEN